MSRPLPCRSYRRPPSQASQLGIRPELILCVEQGPGVPPHRRQHDLPPAAQLLGGVLQGVAVLRHSSECDLLVGSQRCVRMLKRSSALPDSGENNHAVRAQLGRRVLERLPDDLHGGKHDLSVRGISGVAYWSVGGAFRMAASTTSGSSFTAFGAALSAHGSSATLTEPLGLQRVPANESNVGSQACWQRVRERLLVVAELAASADEALLPLRHAGGSLDRALRAAQRPRPMRLHRADIPAQGGDTEHQRYRQPRPGPLAQDR
eukprot:CAMPEP_0171205722 /NCGR_PEP_ID=MMETSP0790-20130122/26695_1 /TAXON_ID=2925 /ORGANISM="Alexandrium catenella, Strain OF101" /LENGTH=262 /DNA_ID=CAMNT_0011671247 /DNA_START=23 /DNA_END=810 /DNA_ORIENTATION=-